MLGGRGGVGTFHDDVELLTKVAYACEERT